MSSSAVHSLIIATAASSIAIVLVGVLRKPLRFAVGARAAYWQWLLVPASVLAALLPAPIHSVRLVADSLPSPVSAALSSVLVSVSATGASDSNATGLAIWLLGASGMLLWFVRSQAVFVRSLGKLMPDSAGIHRSSAIVAPLLLGVWRARIVVPTDFESHYTAEERSLVLAHERAHQVRHDAAINLFATVCLCLAWFNPLMYWAMGRLRFDQELACDALVVAGSKSRRRLYADALLKTQLANDAAWRMPVGCHWQSTHPLKERVAMLKYPSPGLARRLGGIGFTVALTMLGSYAVWAAQPAVPLPEGSTRLIAVNMKWWVNGVDVLKSGGPATARDIRVVSGKEFIRKVSYGIGRAYETRCFVSLSNEDRPSTVWETAKTLGQGFGSGQRVDGPILFECKLSTEDKVFSTPAILVGDSKVGTIEVANQDGSVHYKLEFNASTSAARTAAAQ
jgi:beta-lactamase regulating signal transducer with metallopeptidase domain